METVLAVAALLIGIVALPVVYRRAEALVRKIRSRRWSADLQVEKGDIVLHKDYAFEDWHQRILVDSEGAVVHQVEAHVVNISAGLFDTIIFPVYGDNENVPAERVRPWAACGRRSLEAEVVRWVPARCRGAVQIRITPPLAKGERRKIRWGYELPTIFREGDEYYQWDVSTPHYSMSGEIEFDESWRVHEPRWVGEHRTHLPAPELLKNTIKWSIRFPDAQERYRMDFGLSRRS